MRDAIMARVVIIRIATGWNASSGNSMANPAEIPTISREIPNACNNGSNRPFLNKPEKSSKLSASATACSVSIDLHMLERRQKGSEISSCGNEKK
jgi:hypothetical protein